MEKLQNLRRHLPARRWAEFGPRGVASDHPLHNTVVRNAMACGAIARERTMHNGLARNGQGRDAIGLDAIARHAVGRNAIGLDATTRNGLVRNAVPGPYRADPAPAIPSFRYTVGLLLWLLGHKNLSNIVSNFFFF